MKAGSLERAASRLRLAVIGLMVAIAVALILARSGVPIGDVRVEVRPHGGGALAQLGSTISILLLEVALFRLVQMLGGIAAGEMFSVRVVRHFRGFAFWLLLVALAGLFVPLIAPFVTGAPVADDGRPAFYIQLKELLAVAVTLVLFLLARLLERAREIEDEMREIV